MYGTVSQIRYSRFYFLMSERQGQKGLNGKIAFSKYVDFISVRFHFVPPLKADRIVQETLQKNRTGDTPNVSSCSGNRIWSDNFRDFPQKLRC